MSIVVISQKDSKVVKTIFPFGELKKGEWSLARPKAGADPENNMTTTLQPLTINSLTPPGFGGRVYFPTAVGKCFYTLQVLPAAPAD